MIAIPPDARPANRPATLGRTLCAALLLAATITGCDGLLGNDVPADAPTVQVLSATATPGTMLPLRLTNASATSWGYNSCASPHLQHREGDAWVDGPVPMIVCTADITTLGAGVTLDVPYSVPAGLASGTYRLRYDFGRSDGAVARPLTNSFVVP